jgi:hypothetical protein
MTDLEIKRIEFLQNIISRMAQNSLTIKGWAVTVIAALLAFSNKDTDRRFAFLAVYPALAFWGLDAYYLMKERQFRNLLQKPATVGDEFRILVEGATASAYFGAAFSVTVWPIYVFSLAIAVLLTISNW